MVKLHTKHIIYIIIGIIVLFILYALKNTGYFVRFTGFFVSFFLFFLFDSFFKMDFKRHHYFIFTLISAAGILLSPLYYLSADYDKVLHLVSPALMCILIFFMINKLNTKFSIKVVLTIFCMITILALFEIGEFGFDKLFDWKLQGVYLRDYSGVEKLNLVMDKNDDTMADLILGVIGSLIFAASKTSIFYYKRYFLRKKRR